MQRIISRRIFWGACGAFLFWAQAILAGAEDTFRLVLKVVDDQGESLPCRVHLKSGGEPQKAPGLPFWNDHFVCSGRVESDFKAGSYDYEIERGPEYERRSGRVEGVAGNDAKVDLTLRRIAKLRDAGWYSADLHVHRPLEDVEQLMRAEDLDFAPVITWWNNRNLWKERAVPAVLTRQFDGHRLYNVMAGEDEREGGALLYFGLDRPLDLAGSKREVPSPMQFVEQARRRDRGVWIDIEKPFWWDAPVWLASGRMNSVGIANNHMCRSRMLENEAWGRPRDTKRLANPRGNGLWTQEIYYHVLNGGLRIPPSAGSASGVLPNPVGYNRVYVYLDQPFTSESWFAALARGRAFVTNGPLLVVKANGQFPGAVFKSGRDKSIDVTLEIELASNDRVPRLEVIQNGEVAKTVDLTDNVAQRRSVELRMEAPGWFLVRAVADVEQTFRFASTAPWYVETDAAKNHISRRSAQFFVDWVDERIERVKANVSNEAQREEVLKWHQQARKYWTERVVLANAE